MVRQRAGSALRRWLLQLSTQEAPASAGSLIRLCAGTCPAAELGTARLFSSAAGQLLPELRWQLQQGAPSTAVAPAPCQQLISLRGFRSTTAAGKHALPAVHSNSSGGLPPPQRTRRQPAAQRWPSAAGPPSDSQQALQHQHAAVKVGSFMVDQTSHSQQTECSDATWQRGWAQQPAAPQMLAHGASQPSGTRHMRGVVAAWQRGELLQQAAVPPQVATGQPARGFATAWQRGRAQQAANRRGGRDAAPEPPKKPRTNGEIDGPHVRLVFPDGTHKVLAPRSGQVLEASAKHLSKLHDKPPACPAW